MTLITSDVRVIVRAHEPLVLVQVVVVHVLQHHERLLLRRVRVVHVRQRDHRDRHRPAHGSGPRAGEELHLPGYGAHPGPVRGHRARPHVLFRGHHADVEEPLRSAGGSLGVPATVTEHPVLLPAVPVFRGRGRRCVTHGGPAVAARARGRFPRVALQDPGREEPGGHGEPEEHPKQHGAARPPGLHGRSPRGEVRAPRRTEGEERMNSPVVSGGVRGGLMRLRSS